MDTGISDTLRRRPVPGGLQAAGRCRRRPPPGIDSLEVRIKAFLKQRDNPPHDVYLGVPHRLDRPASGAIVFATRRRAAQKLAQQFEHREVKKLYWACVEGRPDPPERHVAGLSAQSLRQAAGRSRAGRSSRGAAGRAALSDARVGRLGLVAGDRIGDRPHASDSHPSGLARPSACWAISSTARRSRSVRSTTTSDCGRLRCTPGRWSFEHPTSKQRVSVTAPAPEFWPAIAACGFAASLRQICETASGIGEMTNACTIPFTPATRLRPAPAASASIA